MMFFPFRPFYGYHKKEHQFLKIYLYNPAMIKRAADLLQVSNAPVIYLNNLFVVEWTIFESLIDRL